MARSRDPYQFALRLPRGRTQRGVRDGWRTKITSFNFYSRAINAMSNHQLVGRINNFLWSSALAKLRSSRQSSRIDGTPQFTTHDEDTSDIDYKAGKGQKH